MGVKATLIVQIPPVFKPEPQLWVAEKSPLAAILKIPRVVFPVFASETVWIVLVVPTVCKG